MVPRASPPVEELWADRLGPPDTSGPARATAAARLRRVGAIDAAVNGMPAETDGRTLAAAIQRALPESAVLLGFSPEAVATAIRRALQRATGWRLVAVPGLVPDAVFFEHLAERRFPVTVWLRKPEEFDYIVEPDLFHDFFGHVPLLSDPVFADHLQAYGKGGLKAMGLGGLPYLARLYWYTIEFGLIRQRNGLRAYGAGILSSAGELRHAVTAPGPQRIAFDLQRLMRSAYKIDSYQAGYFVIDSFQQLFDATAPDFTPVYAAVRRLAPIEAGVALPGERTWPPGHAPR